MFSVRRSVHIDVSILYRVNLEKDFFRNTVAQFAHDTGVPQSDLSDT